MTSATSQLTFSVPFCHLTDSRLYSNGRSPVGPATGLSRFIGDQSNAILRCLVNPEFVTSRCIWPLVLYGPSGSGKSSLAMSLISDLSNHADDVPLVMSTLDFARRFNSAIETDSVEDFRKRIANSSGVFIDDIQKISTKPAVQNELVFLFDQLKKRNTPFICTLDAAPDEQSELSQQLISRLVEGTCLPINPPGADARRAIIQDLAQINNFQLTDNAVEMLVKRLNVTVPKIIGFFNQLKPKIKIQESENQVISSQILASMFQFSDAEIHSFAGRIISETAQEFHLRDSDLVGSSRKLTVVAARNIAIYLCRNLLGCSFLKVGSFFSDRDHSTIMHSYRKIENLLDSNPDQNDAAASMINTIEKLSQKLSDQIASQITFD